MTTATLRDPRAASGWAITLAGPTFDLFVGPAGGGRSWDDLARDVDALRALAPDWDGQGADAPAAGALDGAAALARGLEADGAVPADRVIAGVNGTVFFEWHGPNGYVEIEVVGPARAEGRWMPRGAPRAVEFLVSRA